MCYRLAFVLVGLFVVSKPADGNEELFSIKHQRSIDVNNGVIRSVEYSPDGRTIAVGGERTVQLFDSKTGQRLKQFHGHKKEVLDVAFSPDGTLLASVGRLTTPHETIIRLWNVVEKGPGRVLRIKNEFQRDRIAGVAFLPDGKTLITCSPNSRSQNRVQLVDLKMGWWTYRVSMVNPRNPMDGSGTV